MLVPIAHCWLLLLLRLLLDDVMRACLCPLRIAGCWVRLVLVLLIHKKVLHTPCIPTLAPQTTKHTKTNTKKVWATVAVSKQLQAPADEISGKFPPYVTGEFFASDFSSLLLLLLLVLEDVSRVSCVVCLCVCVSCVVCVCVCTVYKAGRIHVVLGQKVFCPTPTRHCPTTPTNQHPPKTYQIYPLPPSPTPPPTQHQHPNTNNRGHRPGRLRPRRLRGPLRRPGRRPGRQGPQRPRVAARWRLADAGGGAGAAQLLEFCLLRLLCVR